MNLLEQRLGPAKAAKVIERLGGCRLRVPDRLERDDDRVTKLERMFGRDIAVLIVLHFGGQSLYIPHGGARTWSKVEDVVRFTKSGKSAAFIARKLGCSDRTVYSLRAKARAAGLLNRAI